MTRHIFGMYGQRIREMRCDGCGEAHAVEALQTYGIGREEYCKPCIREMEDAEDERAERDGCGCQGFCPKCTGVRFTGVF